ncbi:MAG TPA: prolipoprotein diacylglyceryl transferase [Acidimicrobiales bacterium]|jgi:phosphatidylglycerol:prolipoprotein diacylglycerol transferase
MTLAAIPYETFPTIDLGPLTIRTFGLMVGLGILVGAVLAARHGERYGVDREVSYRLATRMVVAGVIGARLTWDLTHLSEIDSPLDLIAVWEGGLQFSGGFIAAVLVGLPAFRAWDRVTRFRMLDGYAFGLTVGLALGRVGCYAVGEHLGGTPTSFFLATRYEGGDTREPAVIGEAVHNTALYEILFLVPLAVVLWLVLRRRPEAAPATAVGVFVLWYGVARFLTDFLRAYDEETLGLTGAQWMCLAMVPIGVWLLVRKRRQTAATLARRAERQAARAAGDPAEDGDGDEHGAPVAAAEPAPSEPSPRPERAAPATD